jgi:hypothetical protein
MPFIRVSRELGSNVLAPLDCRGNWGTAGGKKNRQRVRLHAIVKADASALPAPRIWHKNRATALQSRRDEASLIMLDFGVLQRVVIGESNSDLR